MKTVAFLSNKLTLRGTEVAMYDYADYNERLLGNRSIIITRDYEKIKHEYDVDIQAYSKFQTRFPNVVYYENPSDLDAIVSQHGITHLYVIKAGGWDGLVSSRCKTIVHCVFSLECPHGDVYVPIGQTINHLQGTQYPVLPHIVHLPDCSDDFRKEWNIPVDALVFGRYGGRESFDVPFVPSVIQQVLDTQPNTYFLFMNTTRFYEHDRILYLDGTSDMTFKRKFINTCDALLHARDRGETFGLTCGEFAVCEKPVITFGQCHEKEHLLILKEQAVVYNNADELVEILCSFRRDKYDMKNNGYMFYTPENVMNIFREVCL